EKMTSQKFEQKTIPSGEEICRVQLFHLTKTIKETAINREIEQYLPAIEEDLETLSKEELIKKIVSVEFGRFHNYYKDAPNLNEKAKDQGKANTASTRFFINLGSRDGFDWKKLKD